MRAVLRTRLLGALALCMLSASLQAQTLALDLREEIFDIPLAVTGLDGVKVEGTFKLTTFRPPGPGPFPLVVLNHGRSDGKEERKRPPRVRFEIAARYFVRKGFAVASPTRLGYGETVDIGDPEASGDGCARRDYSPQFEIGADHVVASINQLRLQPWADTNRTVVMGISVGGLVTIGSIARRIPGVIAGINVSGGSGGNPVGHPGVPCAADRMASIMARMGRPENAPMLWLYAENDLFFGPLVARTWHSVYQITGAAAELEMLPPFSSDGHNLIGWGNDLWQKILDRWLLRFGFTTPGVLTRPAATGFARLDDVHAVPHIDHAGRDDYYRFLESPLPRAFAISASGKTGHASGDNALSRAQGICQRETGEACRFYAVDWDVVWSDGEK